MLLKDFDNKWHEDNKKKKSKIIKYTICLIVIIGDCVIHSDGSVIPIL